MIEKEDERDIEIARLIASEATRRRGRGRMNREQMLQEKQMQRDILRAMHYKDERKFSEMLRKAGVKDGDERWVNAWKVYRVFWGQL